MFLYYTPQIDVTSHCSQPFGQVPAFQDEDISIFGKFH